MITRMSAAAPAEETTARALPDRRVAVLGVAIVAVGYLAMAVFAGATLPWRGTADAFEHLDYVHQVLQGRLPAPYGHEWSPADGSPGPSPAGRQWVSQHPPLFYLLAAPLAAPWIDGAGWTVAVAVVRGANIVVGLAGVCALGWLGWLVGGRWRVRLAVAIPAVGSATFAYVRYSAEIYNDTLLTTVSLLALALCARMIRRGITPAPTLVLAGACILGLGTKATFVLTLGMVAVGMVVAALVHADGRRGPALLRGLAGAATVSLPPVLVWGWFYARNAELSGSWYQSTPDDVPVLDRPFRSTLEVLGDPQFYLVVPSDLVGDGTSAYAGLAAWSSVTVALVATALTVIALVRLRRAHLEVRLGTALVVGLLLGHLSGHYLIQLSHASGYGAYNWRYFLPSTAAIALVLGLGAASLGRLSAVLLPGLVVTLGALNAGSFVDYGVAKAELAVDPRDVLDAARALATANDLPGFLPAASLAVALGAAIALAALIARHASCFRTVPPRPPAGQPATVAGPVDAVAPS